AEALLRRQNHVIQVFQQPLLTSFTSDILHFEFQLQSEEQDEAVNLS
ncbi:uncharacterized, partial [Tachysurus ichikawai]